MEILDTETLCLAGDNNHQEDVAFLLVHDSIVRGGTGDGATVPHSDKHPLEFYNGKTGAELASRCYKLTCGQADPREPFGRVLVRANDNIRMIHQVLMDLGGSEPGSKLNGLCFGAFEITPTWTRVFWAGDAQVFIRFKNGQIWMTKNEIKKHDDEMYSLVALYIKQAADELELDPKTTNIGEQDQLRDRMWEHFYEPLCRARDERINTGRPKGYSLMNGHPGAPLRWRAKKFYTPRIKLIGSVTDGLMQPRDEFASLSNRKAARLLLRCVEEHGSLKAYANHVEEYEWSKPVGHVRHMEKAGVLVRLA